MQILLWYFGIGALVAVHHTIKFMRGDFDKHMRRSFSETELDFAKQNHAMNLVSAIFIMFTWPMIGYWYVRNFIYHIKVAHWEPIRIDGKLWSFKPWRWYWIYLTGCYWFGKGPPDAATVIGSSPKKPGRVMIAFLRAGSGQMIWCQDLSIENARNVLRQLETTINQVEFFWRKDDRADERAETGRDLQQNEQGETTQVSEMEKRH